MHDLLAGSLTVLSVTTTLSVLACAWHVVCDTLDDLTTRRLKKHYPDITFV